MRKPSVFLLLLVLAMFAAFPARAQSLVDPLGSIEDPIAYTQQLTERMSAEGVEPLRPLLAAMYVAQVQVAGVQLPPQIEAQFATMQGLIAGREASHSRVLEDINRGDGLRTIRFYHYYGDNIVVFTRIDFLRVSETDWMIFRLYWGGQLENIGL